MTKRDEIRNYLRFEAGGASVRRIATAVDETYDVVPDAVVVRRTPPPAPAQVPPPPCEEPVDVQTRPMDEPREVAALAEELAAIGREELEKYERVAVVLTAELEKPAPVEPTVKLRLTVPVSVARRILELVA
jgi:hypothetical protein